MWSLPYGSLPFLDQVPRSRVCDQSLPFPFFFASFFRVFFRGQNGKMTSEREWRDARNFFPLSFPDPISRVPLFSSVRKRGNATFWADQFTIRHGPLLFHFPPNFLLSPVSFKNKSFFFLQLEYVVGCFALFLKFFLVVFSFYLSIFHEGLNMSPPCPRGRHITIRASSFCLP